MPVPQTDPRGPRPGARVTPVALSVVLLAGSPALLVALDAATPLSPTAGALALSAALLTAASGACLGRGPYRTTSRWTTRTTTHREGAPA